MTEWTRHFGCEITAQDGECVVRLTGELDAAAAPLIEGVLRMLAAAGDRLAVDLHAVTFMDSAAAAALLGAEPAPVLLRPSTVAQRLLEGRAAAIGEQPPHVAGERHAVVATDRDGRVTDFNDAATDLFGWQCWEALGRPVAIVGVCPSDEALANEISLAVARGEIWRGEFDVPHRTGSALRVHVRETGLRNGGLLRLCAPAVTRGGARSPQPT